MDSESNSSNVDGIAIIGMSLRVPGANDIDQFWANLVQEKEGITHFSDSEMTAAGVSDSLLKDPKFVKSKGVLDDIDKLDAAFFGILPKEAELMDPQHRIFLECASEALEQAGYDSHRYEGAIGVYGGAYIDTYLLHNLCTNREYLDKFINEIQVGSLQTELGNDKDYLATRVAYKMNLKGPAMTVQTACSSSMVAIIQACQSLQTYQSDMALAGGVTITIPQTKGYLYKEDGMLSPDGHCRPFDADSKGTVFSNGAGIVLLKREAEAIEDGDNIVAVIKGFALNNDGGSKLSFTAPSVNAQAEAIAMAQSMANINADQVGYIEAHGTGTPLGDPIEVAALTKAFRATTDKKQYCSLGSLKSNIGHLDVASGACGLIKTALALKNKTIPACLNFSKPNPQIDFENSPFLVNNKTKKWETNGEARIAGISAFGVGGTNAHIVVQEPPVRPTSKPLRPRSLLTLSARSAKALDTSKNRLSQHFQQNLNLNVENASYTLLNGRREFNHRLATVVSDAKDAHSVLETDDPSRIKCSEHRLTAPDTVFMFPGQGAQHVNMAGDLYRNEHYFREVIDECATAIEPHIKKNLIDILFPDHASESAAHQLTQTLFAQPCIFIIEYALAKLWIHWGITPQKMVGHSIGEFTAACLAGVFTLHEGVKILATRGSLIQNLPTGCMLSVRAPWSTIEKRLPSSLDLAAINGPKLCVISGPEENINEFEKSLEKEGIISSRLHTSHGFHSRMMDPAVDLFAEALSRVDLNPPQIPIISSVTGHQLTDEQATDPHYWAAHMRKTVLFLNAIEKLWESPDAILIEVGPGQTLTTLARQNPKRINGKPQRVLPSLGHAHKSTCDYDTLLLSLGCLWTEGASVNWDNFNQNVSAQRIPLPTYPFQKKSYWIDSTNAPQDIAPLNPSATKVSSSSEENTSPSPTGKDNVLKTTPQQDPLLASLNQILSNLSGIQPKDIDPRLTFLELGFDSLLLILLSKELADQFGLIISMRHLIDETPTPNAIVEQLKSQETNTIDSQSEEVSKKIATNDPLQTKDSLVSEAQYEIWFASHVNPDISRTYNDSRFLNLHGPIDTAVLNYSLNEIVQRHDILRASFSNDGEHLRIAPSANIKIKQVDLSDNDEKHFDREKLYSIAKEDQERIFDLEHTPLIRITLFKINSEEHVLQLTFHHIIVDGWSCSLIIHELGSIYSALSQNQPLPPHESMQYLDFVSWSKTPEQVLRRKNTELYWIDRFKDLPTEIDLPNDRPRPKLKTFTSHRFEYKFGKKTIRDLEATKQKEGCTLYQLLMGSFMTWVYHITGQDDLTIGMPTAGHMDTDLQSIPNSQRLVGHCVNLLPIRNKIEGNEQTFRSFLQQVKSSIFEAQDNQQLSFGRLVEKLYTSRDNSRIPLISTTLNLGSTDHAEMRNLEVVCEIPAKSYNFFDFTVDLRKTHGDLIADCKFNSDLFDSTTIENWLQQWHRIIEQIVANPVAKIGEIKTLADPKANLATSKNEAAPQAKATSNNQKSYWLAQQQASKGRGDHISVGLQFKGKLCKESFERALKETIAHHPILHSGYDLINGELLHSTRPETSSLEIVNHQYPNTNLSEESKRILIEAANQPFDLKIGPIVRLCWGLSPQKDPLAASISIHNIAIDHHSTQLIGKEISERYHCITKDIPFPAITPPPLYQEFIQQQNSWLKSDQASQALNYWIENLTDTQHVLPLPHLSESSSHQSDLTTSIKTSFDPRLESILNEFCTKEKVDPYTVLLTTYHTLVARYSNCYNFPTGALLNNRKEEQFKDTIGCFAPLIPVAPQLEASDSFLESINKLQQCLILAQQNQGISLEQIVNAIPESRVQGHNPLFQVGFSQENPMSINIDQVDIETFHCDERRGRLDLFLRYWQSSKGLEVQLEYSPLRFSQGSIHRMIENFKTLLCSGIENPLDPIGRLKLISNNEEQAIATFNRGPEAHAFNKAPSSPSLQSFFEKQADHSPHLEAIVFKNQSLSYGEFNTKANQLAHKLIERGVKPNSLVGVHIERSLNLPLALYAILKAGGAYVPIDKEYPTERKKFILKDSNIEILLTQSSQQEELEATSLCILNIEAEDLSNYPPTSPNVEIDGSNLAYMIYTSGSTGIPKGVPITHRAIINRLLWMQSAYPINKDDSILQKTPSSFDVSVWEFFWALAQGARLVFATPEGHRDPGYLVDIIQKENISIVHFVPSMLRAFLETDGVGNCHSLRHVISSGEALPADLVVKFYERLPAQTKLHNLYGPTEAAVDVTSWTCSPRLENNTVPIGKPIDNTQTYVFDAYMNPVPIGVHGELYLGGDQVGHGYWQRKELTSERFLHDPYSSTKGAKLFKTGDIVRFLPDGNIEYIDRADSQIKHRGFRIELGEIESVIDQFPGIKCSVVTQVDPHSPTPYLVGYTIWNSTEKSAPLALREHLQAQLPQYMVPDYLIPIDELPLTSNGKLNRKALPKPEPNSVKQSDTSATTNPTEKAIEEIWKKLLNMDIIGIRNNFFDIGGHSMLVIRMKDMISKSMGIDIPIVTLFQYPTIESLAKHISSPAPKPSTSESTQSRASRKRKAIAKRRRP